MRNFSSYDFIARRSASEEVKCRHHDDEHKKNFFFAFNAKIKRKTFSKQIIIKNEREIPLSSRPPSTRIAELSIQRVLCE